VTEFALWYWKRSVISYDIYTDEHVAAHATLCLYDEGSQPLGVQFSDGRLVHLADWAAFAEADEERRQARNAQFGMKPPPRRKITAPFDGGPAMIDADAPAWLGITEE
jgi:hypothetical protein